MIKKDNNTNAIASAVYAGPTPVITAAVYMGPGPVNNLGERALMPGAQGQKSEPSFAANEKKFCQECGSKIDKTDRFCRQCGAKQEAEDTTSTATNTCDDKALKEYPASFANGPKTLI